MTEEDKPAARGVPEKDAKEAKEAKETKETKETPETSKESNAARDGKKKSSKESEEEEELSEEDRQLKAELEMLVERLQESKTELYEPALVQLKDFIRTSTSSMTAVPKPLKFLRPFFPALVNLYDSWTNDSLKLLLADILSVLGMTYSEPGRRESLSFRLKAATDDIGSWGHEYVRHLALELGEEYLARAERESDNKEASVAELQKLALQIVPFFLKHNAEADAVDLLLELESIEQLPQFVDKNVFARVCLYMVSCVPFLAPPDDLTFLHTAYTIYMNHSQLTHALALAVRLDDEELIRNVFAATTDTAVHKQLAFFLSRQSVTLQLDDEETQACLANLRLSEHFNFLARELNLLDPKTPGDIYKTHLDRTSAFSGTSLDSAKQNLASSFANAFLNCGYGSDKLMTDEPLGAWIYKTKGMGTFSTTASLGALYQWDTSEGLQQLDTFMYSSDELVKAGALLGIGIACVNVHDDMDTAFLLLSEQVASNSRPVQIAAVMGLGVSYAGTKDEKLAELLLPLVSDASAPIEVSCLAALALGHVFVGTCHGDITSTILQTLLERSYVQLASKWIRFMALGLGLLFVGKYEQVDDVLETIKAIEHPIAKTLEVLVTICSYAGTGNVLQIQKLLHECTQFPDEEKEDKKEETENGKENENENDKEKGEEQGDSDKTVKEEDATLEEADHEEDDEEDEKPEDKSYLGYAVLGLAAIGMGEEIGADMTFRHFEHLMHYGNDEIKLAVPLAMGLLSPSNPQMKVFETLSRHSHDDSLGVAANAIFSMGLVGAGTNNARIAQLLRQLAAYYAKDADCLFTVRIAQGLLHMGKGAQTLNLYSNDRQNLNKVSFAGLLTVLVALLDPKAFILDNDHYLLYFLNQAIRPRMLVTLDEDLQPLKVNVRVGQAVDVVGQAGRPKTITGWVTHKTPVLLGHGERAELETDQYISYTHALEGVVILKKNEDAMDVDG